MTFFVLFACGRERACEIGGLDLKITNLLPGENDTITIIWYKKGGEFSDVFQSNEMVFEDSLDSINGIVDNTIYLSNWDTRAGQIGYLRGNYDVQVITKSNAYFFSEMYAPQRFQRCARFPGCYTCYSPITLFKLNGELTTKSDFEPVTIVN
jgi:hypothetical protein